ncbi:MAG: NAD(P)-dependent oxidoreductase [Lachnospiraceae bacterium]|nr:NAD(P)-dependent oxidoreductase [Lachnospiraceae bacterium]
MEKRLLDDIDLIANADIAWEKFRNKTVLITGANGYVPQFFVHTLLRRNELFGDNIRVLALCRSEQRARERFAPYLDRADFGLVIQDVCEPLRTEEEIQYYISAASPAGMKTRYADPVATFETNVLGFENILKSAVENPCEGVLLLSSVDVYGKLQNSDRIRESDVGTLDPLNLRNVYSCGKRAAETLGCAYSQKYGIPVYIARPFQILGPGISLEDGRLHADFISQMLKQDEIVLKGDGTPVRSFIYITDAMTALFTILTKGADREAYNVCDENGEASVLQLATTMGALVADRKIGISYNMETRKNDPAVTQTLDCVRGDSSKLKELGWKPQMSLEEACRRMMGYYGLSVKE